MQCNYKRRNNRKEEREREKKEKKRMFYEMTRDAGLGCRLMLDGRRSVVVWSALFDKYHLSSTLRSFLPRTGRAE